VGASEGDLQARVAELAERLNVPGVAVGVYLKGDEQYAVHGVTGIENPLPIDRDTTMQIGSTGKTFTATAIMRLAEAGRLELDAPVRTYVPELRLQDEAVARDVTVLHLLNHTAGWDGDFFEDTGPGDDALARYVELMSDLDQVTPLGAVPSYNNAAVCLAGRVIEKVTGDSFEDSIKTLLLKPLGLDHTFYFPNDVMTRRFSVGHEEGSDGSLEVYRPWAEPRSASPAGGSIASSVVDQIAWARFHLGDGTARDGTRVLGTTRLRQMQTPTVDAGGAIGDHIGISWILREVDGVGLVEHGGNGAGHESAFVMVPERDFAVTVLTNGPGGDELGNEVRRWALQAFLGVVERDPEPVPRSPGDLVPYAGAYETIAVFMDVEVKDGALVLNARVKPEIGARMAEAGESVPEDPPPFPLGMLEATGDRFVVPDGPFKGQRGYFIRDEAGGVQGIHFGGRLATRTKAAPSATS
jgi:CubicO group peptidase (beta-lactamase class C family)